MTNIKKSGLVIYDENGNKQLDLNSRLGKYLGWGNMDIIKYPDESSVPYESVVINGKKCRKYTLDFIPENNKIWAIINKASNFRLYKNGVGYVDVYTVNKNCVSYLPELHIDGNSIYWQEYPDIYDEASLYTMYFEFIYGCF